MASHGRSDRKVGGGQDWLRNLNALCWVVGSHGTEGGPRDMIYV